MAARVRHVPPDPPLDTSPAAVARAENRVATATEAIRAARRDAQAGAFGPYRVELSENDLNTLLRTDARAKRVLRRHNVARPSVRMDKNRLRASALVSIGGQQVYATAEGVLVPDKKGQLQFQPDALWLGDVRAPQALTQQVAQRLARALQGGALSLPGQIQAVRLDKQRLRIEGNTKP